MHLIAPADEWLDALHAAHDAARGLVCDRMGMVGYGVAHLLDGDGRTKQLVPFHNLITDAGDLYYAGKINRRRSRRRRHRAPTAANGMKLGTGVTAASKASTGAVRSAPTSPVPTSPSTRAYASTANLGTTLGVNAVYKTTWAAGTATNAAITEVGIVNDQATNTTSAAANTYSRAVITLVNKTASDSLAITWNWKALGA
jgi:hypothetical protein